MPPTSVLFKGHVYKLSGSYYVGGPKEAFRLHRAIYEDAHGPIPDGHVVHHIDFNPLNNRLGNLLAMPDAEHRQLHYAISAQKLSEWHASQDGRAWHVKNGKESWVNRKLTDCNCVECGATFQTAFPTRTKFCGNNCKSRHRRRTHPEEARKCWDRFHNKNKASKPTSV